MELTELSLASSQCVSADKTCNLGPSSDLHHQLVEGFNFPSKKRKLFSDQFFNDDSQFQTSVDLQVKDPLPLDWEQCLDLESGKMYYMNRKTLEKTWNWPEDHKLNLELNISPTSSNGSEHFNGGSISSADSNNNNKQQQHFSSTTNMVALPCLNCHLLVILPKSSPACPNCKYVHSFPTLQTTKCPNTLSLLN
ncbi:E3 ubiquitin-protein ligase Itchy [Gossypium australe]|uniref:E3 ubiquitin-protein ligase Itchy n=1 Tax=Gossypium australe TaxID=47621 RepID=A0A5B6WUG8_9ROSI|nr:E3 ubiquitin-protein ligase Itchy [Gossypium australe]